VVKATGGHGAYDLFHGKWCDNTNIPAVVNPGTGFQVQMKSTGWGAAGGLSFFVYDAKTGAQILDGDHNSLEYTVRNPEFGANRHACQFAQCPEDRQDACLSDMDSNDNPELTDIRGTVAGDNYGYGAYKSGCRDDCSQDFNVVMYWKDKSTSEF
jgi:hypothetical protein